MITQRSEQDNITTALNRQLNIKFKTILMAAIPFITSGTCFFLMAWAEENKESSKIGPSVLTGFINGLLYANALTQLLLIYVQKMSQLFQKIRQTRRIPRPSRSQLLYWMINLNFSFCGALMMPGDFFSTQGTYPNLLIWTGGIVLWLEESLLMQEPIEQLMIAPVKKLISWLVALSKIIIQKITCSKPLEHSSAQNLLTNPHAILETDSPDQILEKIATNPVLRNLTAQELEQVLFKNFPPDSSSRFESFFKALLGLGMFFLAVPFYLGATGSMERAADQMSVIRYFPIFALSNLLLLKNSIASAIAGSGMLLLFTYYPTLSLYSALDHLIFKPIAHAATVQYPNPLIPLKSVVNWSIRVGMVAACIKGLLSALAIEIEGQKRMIQDGGLPGNVIEQYINWGFTTSLQVLVIATALNSSGCFGLLNKLQTRAKLGLSQVKYLLWTTEPYSEKEKAQYWLQSLKDAVTSQRDSRTGKISAENDIPANIKIKIRDCVLLAQYHARESRKSRTDSGLSIDPPVYQHQV